MKKSFLLLFAWFFLPLCLLAQHPNLQAGPMLGYVEMQEAMIWVQTNSAAKVGVTYWLEEAPETKYRSKMADSNERSFYTVKIPLIDLQPGSTYEYEITIDGQTVNLPYPTEFSTQELWQWRIDAPEFSFAIGSCLYINEEAYDRPGQPYGGNYEILEAMADQKPDFMLWTGDNTYLRDPDFYSEARMLHRYSHTRSLPELQRFLASTAHYATWDDHDYGPNNSDRSYSKRDFALNLFSHFWANPSAGHDGEKGVYFRFKWVDVEFFMTDGRYHRAPNALKDPAKDYLGEKQMQWLKDALANSDAAFKVVVFGNQALNVNTPFEAFPSFTREYNDLLGFLEYQQIPGVVFISGDRHHTELLKYETAGQYPLYEYTSSPLTSGASSRLSPIEQNNPLRVPGTLVQARNFGIVKVTGKGDDRQLVLSAHSVDGSKLWEQTIRLTELQPRVRRD